MSDEPVGEAEEIHAGERIHAFLNDETVKAAFARLSDQYHREWKTAESAGEREALWARSRAVDELSDELRRVVDTGHRAAAVRNIRRGRRDKPRA